MKIPNSDAKLKILLNHVKKNKYKGYDPSSIYGSFLIRKIYFFSSKIKPSFFAKFIDYPIAKITNFFPKFIIFILKIKERTFSKGNSLILKSLIEKNKSKKYNNEEKEINFLYKAIINKKLSNNTWAHDVPYKINQGGEVSVKTPNMVTTTFVANTYFYDYLRNKSIKSLQFFKIIVNSSLEIFPIRKFKGSLCFMYTPNSNYHVHNANLMMADLLLKINYLKLNKNEKIIDHDTNKYRKIAEKSIRFTLDSFDQFGEPIFAGGPSPNMTIDNYHTGYIIRLLNSINYIDPELGYKYKLGKRINWLLDKYYKYFVFDVIIKDKHKTIEAHSLAESILIYCLFKQKIKKEKKIIFERAIINTEKILWDENKNYYINSVNYFGPFKFTNNVHMVRWSSAWMIYALTKLNSKSSNKSLIQNIF